MCMPTNIRTYVFVCGTKVVCTGCLYVDCRRTTPSPVGGVLPPLFRLIHPQPLMTQAKQNKERFIHRRRACSLVLSSFSLSFPVPLLSTPFYFSLSLFLFLYLDGPPSLSRYFFRPPRTHINSSLRFPSFTCSLALDAGSLSHLCTLIASVCLSILPTYTYIYTPIFYSFSLSVARLTRSLTCAQMKSIKMLGATSRQSCSTPTPSFPFTLFLPRLRLPVVLRFNLRQTPTPLL